MVKKFREQWDKSAGFLLKEVFDNKGCISGNKWEAGVPPFKEGRFKKIVELNQSTLVDLWVN